MMKIDFNVVEPTFINGDFKWYLDEYFQNYIGNMQAVNLPKINDLACFIVRSNNLEDYVLIDNKQNVVAGYPYTDSGFEQMLCKINIIKIAKHYDEHEKSNI